jgi:hypothetical protein
LVKFGYVLRLVTARRDFRTPQARASAFRAVAFPNERAEISPNS